jgi:hypothetical protein
VPPQWRGHNVTCRVEVDSDILEVTAGATVIARHSLQPDATEPVWDPVHLAAAEAIALGRHRPTLRVVPDPEPDEPVIGRRLDLGDGDYDVAAVDLEARYGTCGCTGQGA